jgi:glutathionylspermidine synthase
MKKKDLPKSYYEQKACSNCKYCYIWGQQDENVDYYCEKEGDRPLSGICLSNEDWAKNLKERDISEDTDEFNIEYEKLIDDWSDWSNSHRVVANGICDEYEKEDEREVY